MDAYWPSRDSSNILLYSYRYFLTQLYQYVSLPTNHSKNSALTHLFLFICLWVSRADLLIWARLRCCCLDLFVFSGGSLAGACWTRMTLLTLCGKWLSMKIMGWIGRMFLIVQQACPNLFSLVPGDKEGKHVTLWNPSWELTEYHFCFMLLAKGEELGQNF